MFTKQQLRTNLDQIPAYLWDMAPGELEPFFGTHEQVEKVWASCHKSYYGCRLWQSVLTDEDGEKLVAIFLDYEENGNLVYWGTFDI